MKKGLIILALIPLFCFSQPRTKHSIIFGTGTANNSSYSGFYNVKDYGAHGDGVTIETPYIQAAVDACHTGGGGKVKAPAGTYLTGQIETYPDVTIVGDGQISTFFRSLADTVFSIHNLDEALANAKNNGHANVLFEDFSISGHGAGKVGIYIDRAANFHMKRLLIDSFTTGKNLVLRNTLIGTVEEVYLSNAQYDAFVYADGTFNTASTKLTFLNCTFYYAKKQGIDYSGGGQLVLRGNDFAVNGTSGDSTTGCIYYHNNPWSKGTAMYDNWFEENVGGQEVWIGTNTPFGSLNYPAFVTHEIYASNQQGHSSNFTKRNIYISGSNQKVLLSGGDVFGAALYNNIVMDGSSNSVEVDMTTFDAASANIIRGTGNSISIKGFAEIYHLASTPPDPPSGKAVMWFDGTNLKVKKNVAGTVTTTTLF